jgi:hypothetical protein
MYSFGDGQIELGCMVGCKRWSEFGLTISELLVSNRFNLFQPYFGQLGSGNGELPFGLGQLFTKGGLSWMIAVFRELPSCCFTGEIPMFKLVP